MWITNCVTVNGGEVYWWYVWGGGSGGEGGNDGGGQSEITAVFLSSVEGIRKTRKYLMKFHVEIKMMAALSSNGIDYTLFSRK